MFERIKAALNQRNTTRWSAPGEVKVVLTSGGGGGAGGSNGTWGGGGGGGAATFTWTNASYTTQIDSGGLQEPKRKEILPEPMFSLEEINDYDV
jgi:hypothetical protein